MTEIFIDVCNSSRQILPTVSSITQQITHADENPEITYRLLYYCVFLGLQILRHIMPPTFLILFVCKLWGYYIASSRDSTCRLLLPPGDCGFPLVGETIQLLLFGKSFYERKRKLYGDIYRTHLLGKPTIRVVGADNVKRILRGENTLVATQWPESTRILLGEGSLATAFGENHIYQKRAIMRAFSFDALARYVPVIQEVTQKYVNRWVEKGRILGYPEFKTLNFDLSCRLLIGAHMSEDECGRLMEIFDTFNSNIFSLPINVYGSGFRKGICSRDLLLQKIDDVMRDRQANDSYTGDDVLSIMLSAKNQEDLSISEIKNMCLELLFAGHGTVSNAACYLVYELAKHPEVREKLEAEMMSHGLLRTCAKDESCPGLSLHQLNKMTYLNNIVKEVLRLSPPVGGGFRKALRTFEIGGFQVPKDWTIIYGIRDTQETSGYYSDGQSFNPSRWDSVQMSEVQFKYLPFGGGRRACAGKDLARLMLKIFAFDLVQRSQWTLESDSTMFEKFPLPRPTDDLPLLLKHRNKNV